MNKIKPSSKNYKKENTAARIKTRARTRATARTSKGESTRTLRNLFYRNIKMEKKQEFFFMELQKEKEQQHE